MAKTRQRRWRRAGEAETLATALTVAQAMVRVDRRTAGRNEGADSLPLGRLVPGTRVPGTSL
jgi:hypothetical protein